MLTRINHDIDYVSTHYQGTIMVEGTKLPDLKRYIVSQPALGLFKVNKWADVRSQLRGAISANNPDQSIPMIIYILESVGYKAKNTSTEKFYNNSKIIELINKSTEPLEVLHETDHMKSIFELIDICICSLHKL